MDANIFPAFSFMDFDLSEVARNGCFSVLNVALNNVDLYNFDVNCLDKTGNCLLHYAAEKGDVQTVEKLLSLKAYPNICNKQGRTPLHLACLNNHELTLVVKLLINNQANVNARDQFGETPMFLAVRNGNIPLIKLLMSKGADITIKNKVKQTLLHAAVESKEACIVDFFINQKLEVNSRDMCGETCILMAVRSGLTDIVNLLLKHDRNCDIKDNNGNNLIHLSIQSNQRDICSLLINNKININEQNKEGCSPLHIAAEYNFVELISILAENGAIIDLQDIDGYTPLHVACNKSEHAAAVEALLTLRAKTDILSSEGDLPFHRAAASGNIKAFQLLYRKNILTWKNKSGYTPIMLAEYYQRTEILRLVEDIESNKTNRVVKPKDENKGKRVSFGKIPVRRY